VLDNLSGTSQQSGGGRVINALSVDVEDWYQAFEMVGFEQWRRYSRRIVSNTSKILKILKEFNTLCTFFVLGHVAKEFPELVHQISEDGHEIAAHGYSHRRVYNMTPNEFMAETERSIGILEQVTHKEVLGYRAPWFSITDKSFWALDVLVKLGLKYDSSIFPGSTGVYGISRAKNIIHRILTASGEIIEFPPCSFGFRGIRFGCGGGFYLRSLPYSINYRAIKRKNQRGFSVMTYVHPWEFDSGQPKLSVSIFEKFIHYYGLAQTENKFRMLLNDFVFLPVREVLGLEDSLES